MQGFWRARRDAWGPDPWGPLGDYAAAYSWFLGLQLLDLMSTLAVIGRGGAEANPLAAMAIANQGLPGALAWKLGIILLTLLVWVPAAAWVSGLPAPVRRWASPMVVTGVVMASMVYTAVVFHNLAMLAVLVG